MGALAWIALALAAAAPDTSAEALIQRGIELRKEGRNEEALALFGEALAAAPTPRARAQVALAEQALGRWVEAEIGLAAALGAAADPWIARNRAPLEEALAKVRARLGSLHVATNAAPAELWVNGTRTATLPLPAPVRVVAGDVVVEVRAAGHESLRRVVKVPAGLVAREVMPLVAAAPPPPPPPAAAPLSTAPPPGAPPSGRPWIGGGLLGLAGVALAVAIGAHVSREDHAAAYNRMGCPPEMPPEGCASEAGAVSIAEIVMGLGYGGAAALAGVGLWLVLGDAGGSAAVSAQSGPAPRNGAALAFSF